MIGSSFMGIILSGNSKLAPVAIISNTALLRNTFKVNKCNVRYMSFPNASESTSNRKFLVEGGSPYPNSSSNLSDMSKRVPIC